jgi:peptide/nickel transport system substrate-binding protein
VHTRRDILYYTAAGAASFALLPKVGRAAAKPQVTVGIGADVLTVDPHRIAAGADFFVAGNVFEGLYGHDETGKLTPALAESVEISPDGKTYTFTLKANAKFHNGQPVTSADVIASYERGNNPRNPMGQVVIGNIDVVTAIDARKCEVRLKRRDISFLHNCGTYWYIVPKNYDAISGDGKLVGSGPFKLAERRIKEFIKLDAFDDHWGRVPKISSVTMRITPDDQARVAQILSGEVDIAANVPPVLARRLGLNKAYEVITGRTLWFSYIHVNALGNKFLAKLEVRKALDMAIDKESLNKTLMLGFATPTELLCGPGVVGCDVKVEPHRYDPKKARQMLEKAGFDFTKPLKFAGLSPGRVPQSKEVTEGIAAMLRQIGVQTEIIMLEFGAWSAVRSAKSKDMSYDLIFGQNGDFNNGDPVGRLLRQVRSDGSFAWYSNPEVDPLIDRANDFSSEREREENLRQVFSKLHADVPVIPLWSVDLAYVATSKISWQPTPNIQWPLFWNIEKAA